VVYSHFESVSIVGKCHYVSSFLIRISCKLHDLEVFIHLDSSQEIYVLVDNKIGLLWVLYSGYMLPYHNKKTTLLALPFDFTCRMDWH
jgi:hypothetical protein